MRTAVLGSILLACAAYGADQVKVETGVLEKHHRARRGSTH